VSAAYLGGKTPAPVADAKAEATLQAEFALAGWQLVKLGDDTFLAERWGKFRALRDLGAARAFLEIVRGQKSGATAA